MKLPQGLFCGAYHNSTEVIQKCEKNHRLRRVEERFKVGKQLQMFATCFI